MERWFDESRVSRIRYCNIRIRWLVCIMDTVGCNCQYFGFSFGLLSGARVRRNSLPMIVRSYVWRCSRTMSSMERIKVASYFERFSNFVLFFFFLRGERWIEIYHIGSIVVNRIIVNYRKIEREKERLFHDSNEDIFYISPRFISGWTIITLYLSVTITISRGNA